MGGGGGGWWMGVVEDADVQRGGEGRHDGRKYNNLLFGEDGNGPMSTSQALCTGHLMASEDQRSTYLKKRCSLSSQWVSTGNNGKTKGRRMDTHQRSSAGWTGHFPYGDIAFRPLRRKRLKRMRC